jgi:hypothetical protein
MAEVIDRILSKAAGLFGPPLLSVEKLCFSTEKVLSLRAS